MPTVFFLLGIWEMNFQSRQLSTQVRKYETKAKSRDLRRFERIRAEVVAQLAEWSLQIPEIRGSNLTINARAEKEEKTIWEELDSNPSLPLKR